MILKKGVKVQITKNFDSIQFFSKAPGVTSHFIDDKLPTAAQLIRDHYNIPLYVTSSYRPSWYNTSIGGATSSRHITGEALDLSFQNEAIHQQYNHDINTQGTLYRKLQKAGINGFGLYNGFMHIDTRSNLTVWGEKKNLTIDSEDGIIFSSQLKQAIILTFFIIILTLLSFITWQ